MHITKLPISHQTMTCVQKYNKELLQKALLQADYDKMLNKTERNAVPNSSEQIQYVKLLQHIPRQQILFHWNPRNKVATFRPNTLRTSLQHKLFGHIWRYQTNFLPRTLEILLPAYHKKMLSGIYKISHPCLSKNLTCRNIFSFHRFHFKTISSHIFSKTKCLFNSSIIDNFACTNHFRILI